VDVLDEGIPIWLFTGMTPEARLYARLLPLLPNASVVPWISPRANETLQQYARRLSVSLARRGPCFVAGTSFGGIVAQEVGRLLSARCCCLISSVRNPSEMPPHFRVWRHMPARCFDPFVRCVGGMANFYPRRWRSAATMRLTKFAGGQGRWHRWATGAVLGWRPRMTASDMPVFQIHGSTDATFPLRYVRPDAVIAGGGHVLPLTHPEEVAAHLTAAMAKFRAA
jgi:pimeloyl-ACP methyl ester carboxylesterase